MRKVACISIFALSLLVLALGTTWGFPFIYHPDEPVIVRDAIGVAQFNAKLEHFDWPHLQTYLDSGLYTVFIKGRGLVRWVGLENMSRHFLPIMWEDGYVFYFLSRLRSVLMGSLTALLVFLMGSKLRSSWVGLLSALFLLTNTLFLDNARLATIDVPMTFWLTLSLLFCFQVVRKGGWMDYLLAGLLVGLATSTKYNGGAGVLTIGVAMLLSVLVMHRSWWVEVKKLFLAGLSSLFGFFVGTPNALFEYRTFIRTDNPVGAFWQFKRSGNSGDLDYVTKLNGRLHLLINSSGVAPFLLSLGALLEAFAKRRWEYLLLGSFPCLYFLYASQMGYFQPHFFVPILPYLALLGGLAVWDLAVFFKQRGNFSNINQLGLFGLMGVIILIQPFGQAALNRLTILQEDTRTVALKWINANLPDGAVIAMGRDYEPQLPERSGPPSVDKRPDRYYLVNFSDVSRDKKYRPNLVDKLREKGVEYLVFGSFNLGQQYDAAQFDSNNPTSLGWLKQYCDLIARFEPQGRPGPTVLVFRLK